MKISRGYKPFLFTAAAVFCGWIAAFSMSPVSVWPCLFAGLSGLYYLYGKTSSGPQAFAAGFFFALGYFVTGLWWIGNALLVEGNEFAWVWPISVVGLPTLLALFTGTYLGIARMIAAPDTPKGFLYFVFFLTFSEWARGHAFTGFPWNLYGYVWADYLAMAQSAYYLGAYGLTFVSVLWASLAGYLLLSRQSTKAKTVQGLIALVSLCAVWAAGQYRLDTHKTAYDTSNALVVVQPNIEQNMKWDPVAAQDNFSKIISLSKGHDFEKPGPKNIFIVWPETAIAPNVYSIPENMDRIRSVLRTYKNSKSYLITGVLRREEKEDGLHYANSVALLNQNMDIMATYDKSHLVPFGEFIPFQKWIPLKPVVAFRGFDRGHGATSIEFAGLPSFSPLICYEVIFPGKVVDHKHRRPSWIVNVTNDGWYGDSAGPHQHFAQSRLRAIEEGLPLVRSANTGISGVFDSYGRGLERAGLLQEAVLVTYLPEPLPDRAVYWPHLFQIIFPLLAIYFLVTRNLQRRS